MKRALIFGILSVLTLLSALGTGHSLYYRALYALVLTMLGSWLWARLNVSGLRVHVERNVHRARVGDEIAERISIWNRVPVPKAWLEVEDQTTMPGGGSAVRVISMGGRGFRTWKATFKAQRRGVYSIGPVRVTSGDPLGLFTLNRYFLQPEELVVYPATVPLPHIRLLAAELAGEGPVRLRSYQATPHAASVRDYHPGDPLNRIHWPSSARSGRLMLKEFDQGTGGGLWVIVDFYGEAQRGEGAQTTDEYAATIAASIGQRYLYSNIPVGLIADGDRRCLLPAQRGEAQFNQMLENLARLRAEGRIPFHEILAAEAGRFDRNDTVVVITPSQDPAWVPLMEELTRRRVRTAAVLLDGASFGGGGTATRVREAVAKAGVLTYVVHKGDELTKTLALSHARTDLTDSRQQPRESLV